MDLHFNAAEAAEAQAKYCEKNEVPMFAPNNGRCVCCGRNIYDVGGISVETAGKKMITGCPFCDASFCD